MSQPTVDRLKGREATLDRWPGERRDHHRALLLFAMQGSAGRSRRAVARAMGLSDGCIRNWLRNDCWLARIHAHGEAADQDALVRYRMEYMADHGTLEVPHIAKYIIQPLGNLDLRDPATKLANEAAVRAHNAVPLAQVEAEQAVAQAVATHRRDSREIAERHIKLVDGALGVIAKKLKADEVRVSVRDIPVLIECRAHLEDVVSGTRQDGARRAVDSARLAHAKEVGGNLVEAMHEDALELVAILGALCAAKDVDVATLAEVDQRVRDEAATA